jgi:hypothetical protein
VLLYHIAKCVHRRTFAKYAVKIVDKNLLNDPERWHLSYTRQCSGSYYDQRKALVDELAIHKLINHVNIITCYETYETLHQVYIVTELCEGGSVFSLFDEVFLSLSVVWLRGFPPPDFFRERSLRSVPATCSASCFWVSFPRTKGLLGINFIFSEELPTCTVFASFTEI